MTVVIYHSDLDGHCAGYVVGSHTPVDTFIEMNYGFHFPIDKINKDEKVYIVDFHFEPDVMKEILKITENVVLIDHHKSCLKKYETLMYQEPFNKMKFIIDDISYSGCELAWLYFNEEKLREVIGYPYDMDFEEILSNVKDNRKLIPEIIRIVADRDLWKWEYGKLTYDVNNALEGVETNPSNVNWKKFNVEELEEVGGPITNYIVQRNKELIKFFHHIVKFEGYECDCMNVGKTGSDLFDSINGSDLKPLQIMYIHNGITFEVSLRSGGKYEDIDVSEIAVKYGGGGHQNAAGFEIKELPWETVNEN